MNKLLKSFIIVLFGVSLGLIFYRKINLEFLQNKDLNKPTKVQIIKNQILKYKKPARIEVETYTQKYKKDIEDIKKIKIPMDTKANFYIQLQLFSDDTDEKSPLVLQMKFKDIKTNNLIQETSINVE